MKNSARSPTPDSTADSEGPSSVRGGKKAMKGSRGKLGKAKASDATSTVLNNMVSKIRPNKSEKKEKGDKKRGFASEIGVNILSRARVKQVKVDELAEDSLIIAVMGPTGSGKSSFINTTTGYGQGVGHTLESCTSDISVVKFSCQPLFPTDIYFVDTPGFDDTKKSDTEIFTLISNWLNKTYESHIKLSGLLYFHRISDNRMAGTPLKNLRMFEKLVGSKFHNIILTTTMWDEVDEDAGAMREEELKSVYWKTMIDRGSSTARFQQTTQSAFQLLSPLLDEANKRETLLLQKEVTDLGYQLRATSAGQELFLELEHLVKRQQDMLERIREEMKHPATDEEQLRLLMDEYQKITSKLASTSKQVSELRINIGVRLGKAIKFVIGWQFLKGLFQSKLSAKSVSQATVRKPPSDNPEPPASSEIERADGDRLASGQVIESDATENSSVLHLPNTSSGNRSGETGAEDEQSFRTAISGAASVGVQADPVNDKDEKASSPNVAFPASTAVFDPSSRPMDARQETIVQSDPQVARDNDDSTSRLPERVLSQAHLDRIPQQMGTKSNTPNAQGGNHDSSGYHPQRAAPQTQTQTSGAHYSVTTKNDPSLAAGRENTSSAIGKNSTVFPTGDRCAPLYQANITPSSPTLAALRTQ